MKDYRKAPHKKPTDIPGDLEIAQAASPKPIIEITEEIGLSHEDIIPYGRYKAKVRLDVLERFGDRPNGKYINVTAITPTPLSEGKTTVTIGLTQALGSALGKSAACCLRQPSMGPTFNIKGGAAGGGYSQVLPMEDFNLHFTGDIHAVGAAHNLAAAALDSRMYHESRQSDEELRGHGITSRLDIDPDRVTWNRVLDVCDRSLRKIDVGINDSVLKDGSPSPVFPRKTGFDITEASELMAILSLSDSLKDLRERTGRVVVALNKKGKPVTLEELGVAGSVTTLLKDAIMPNLVQTLEGQPVFVHCGPFANIAHGNSSIIADKIALKLADYVITESGFGADIGMEKFLNIKCRQSGLIPDAVVLVATVRALKMHGGGPEISPGAPLDRAYRSENLPLLKAGLANLGAHIRIALQFGIPLVVALNRFTNDTSAELDMARQYALDNGAFDAVITNHWAEGGKGAAKLAETVISACEKPANFKFLYPLDWPIKRKIETIAREIYGADGVSYEKTAEEQIDWSEKMGLGKLPICMAKTPFSLSHDPYLKGVPKGFTSPFGRSGPASVQVSYTPLLESLIPCPEWPHGPPS